MDFLDDHAELASDSEEESEGPGSDTDLAGHSNKKVKKTKKKKKVKQMIDSDEEDGAYTAAFVQTLLACGVTKVYVR